MADDALEGFKFIENDDIERDAAARIASNSLFLETAQARAGGLETAPVKHAAPEVGGDALGGFDFTEGFDFIL